MLKKCCALIATKNQLLSSTLLIVAKWSVGRVEIYTATPENVMNVTKNIARKYNPKPKLILSKMVTEMPIKNSIKVNNMNWRSATQIADIARGDHLTIFLRKFRQTPSQPFSVFSQHIMKVGRVFEEKVIESLAKSNQHTKICEKFDWNKIDDTFKEMKKGTILISSAPVSDRERKTYGIIDLLVRSDYFNTVFNQKIIPASEMTKKASNLPDADYHYIPVEIKYTTLYLNSDGLSVGNTYNLPKAKYQLLTYTLALNKMQGYMPESSYIIGRAHRYESKGTVYKSRVWSDKIGQVNWKTKNSDYLSDFEAALKWIDKMNVEGKKWEVNPPSEDNLFPDMKIDSYDLQETKTKIAVECDELTLLPYVTRTKREMAWKQEIYDLKDPRLNASIFKLTGQQADIVNTIIQLHRSGDNFTPSPDERLPGLEEEVRELTKSRKLYIDFETMNDLCEDFNNFPECKTGQTIFMISLINEEGEKRTWTMQDNTSDEEIRIVDEFFKFVKDYHRENGSTSLVHWADIAEPKMINDVREKYPKYAESWKFPKGANWFDMCELFRRWCICFQGQFNFGLKTVVNCAHKGGHISFSYDGVVNDGLSAMIGAFNYYNSLNTDSVQSKDVIKNIEKYNVLDCQAMVELFEFLHKNYYYAEPTKKRRRLKKVDEE